MSKLEKYRWDAYNCIRCSNCKWVDPIWMQSQRFARICPINVRHHFDVYSGQGLLDFTYGKLYGMLDYTPRLLDSLYKCTLCGACDIMCKRNLDLEVIETIEELRAQAYEDKKGPPKPIKAQIEAIRREGNPWGKPRRQWDHWSRGLKVKRLGKEKAPVLYYTGCKTPYTPELQTVARNVVNILNKAGVDFGILAQDEVCCGLPAYAAGDREVAASTAAGNIDAFNRLGVSQVIVSCADCYGMLKGRYPAFGQPKYEVLHVVELFDRLIGEGKLKIKQPLNMKVTYHDPCFLGRRGEKYIGWEGTHGHFGLPDPPREYNKGTHGIYEPPRNILKALGVELVEMERIRENAWCCGAGAADTTRTAYPDFALWTAAERLEEAEATGAEALVTACPYCEDIFRAAVTENGYRLQVLDVVELLARAI
ncbi:MAG: (Fe-S)-binding protein [Chloroflexota bacterium]